MDRTTIFCKKALKSNLNPPKCLETAEEFFAPWRFFYVRYCTVSGRPSSNLGVKNDTTPSLIKWHVHVTEKT
jgi:hypothetical protein